MEQAVEEVKKARKPRSDKGKSHGPRRKASVPPAPILFAAEPPAPINVRIKLKGEADFIEFGAEERSVENGFHVFTYPSERDRYRTTRREFAISEIKEIEITAARGQVRITQAPEATQTTQSFEAPHVITGRGPQIHSVKKNAANIIGALETSSGPIKMDTLPSLTFGDSAG